MLDLCELDIHVIHPSLCASRLHRDNKVFKNLLALMEPGLAAEEVRKLAKEVVQRVGTRGAQGDFCRALCCRLAPGLLLPEQLQVCITFITRAQYL